MRIEIQGRYGLVGKDGITKRDWAGSLMQLPKPAEGAAELGSQANPLQVTGPPLPGG